MDKAKKAWLDRLGPLLDAAATQAAQANVDALASDGSLSAMEAFDAALEADLEDLPGPDLVPERVEIKMKAGKGYDWLAKEINAAMAEVEAWTGIHGATLRSRMSDQMLYRDHVYVFSGEELLAGGALTGGMSASQIQTAQRGLAWWEEKGREEWLAQRKAAEIEKEMWEEEVAETGESADLESVSIDRGGLLASGIEALGEGWEKFQNHLKEAKAAKEERERALQEKLAELPAVFRIELKAWIPHSEVVDPEEQVRISDWLDTLTDLTTTPFSLVDVDYEFKSTYRGDNHTGYNGSYRAISTLEFVWDGTSISGVKARGGFGKTHRDWEWEAKLRVAKQEVLSLGSDSGSESERARSATAASAKGNAFHLSIDSANPVVMTWAPEINSALQGYVTSREGELKIFYKTDGFPSHGIRVFRNGVCLDTAIVNDASGVPGTGVSGLAAISTGLMSMSNSGSYAIPGISKPN